jgi:hypothetical protein
MKDQSSDKLCKQFGDVISAYFDGQLTEAQMTEVENHLRECPLCSRQLEHYRLIRNLINLEKQNSPVDLNATVMAGMEREQLLSGLDELAKPPTPAWTRILRTVAAAAMILLVIYAGSLVVQFAGNNTRQPALRQAPKRTFAENTSGKYESHKPKRPLILGTDNSTPVRPSLMARAKEDLVEVKGFRSSTSQSQSGLSDRKNRTAGTQPTQPLVLRPSGSTETVLDKLTEPVPDISGGVPQIEPPTGPAIKKIARLQSLETQIPPELKIQLWAPDLPSWMLLKEQLLEILKESHVPNLLDPEQISSDLNAGKEFFYQARKGLDLAPGTARSELLLLVSPDQFRKIHDHFQLSALETIRQDLRPELKNVLTTQPLSPELVHAGIQTIRNLDNYFSPKESALGDLGKPASAPATTTATTTSSGPATRDKFLLPILIVIEMPPCAPPATTTATTTQTTQTSQPTTREITTTQP